MSPPGLLDVPYEVLVRIALETACIDVLGPPAHLPALLRTCRHIYNAIGRSTDLFARIFKAKFDVSAARRRLGPIALLSRNLAAQLKKYAGALRRIRAGDIYAQTLEGDLWTAFIMLSESDAKNAVQLREYARLPAFVDRLVRARLHEDRLDTGWPVESTVNNLALWLLWMVTDPATLEAETREDRERLIRLLLPFVICCFRYNAFLAADIHYNLPLLRDELPALPHSLQTAHGRYPQYPDPASVTPLTHFGQRVALARPPAPQAAQLLYFARRERGGLPVPPGLPADRAAALALGEATGPTRADYAEFNASPGARLLSWGDWDWRARLSPAQRAVVDSGRTGYGVPALSARFDADWERLAGCGDPYAAPPTGMFQRYTPGSLAGRWVGRMLLPDEAAYMAMVAEPVLPAFFGESFPFSTMRPVMLTLREHHCVSPEEPVDFGTRGNGLDEGVLNAYLPALSMFVEPGGVTFTEAAHDPAARVRHRYETVEPGQPSSHSAETCAYCHDADAREGAARAARLAEIEELFDDAGVGRAASSSPSPSSSSSRASPSRYDDDGDVDMDDGEEEEEDDMEATIEEGACNGVLDIAFTGLTEQRHGDAWCHYMYYGRLREWDGLIVLVGVPNDVNARLWGKWVFRGYLHAGQNFTGRWRHYAYDVFSPPYEGAFTLSKRDD